MKACVVAVFMRLRLRQIRAMLRAAWVNSSRNLGSAKAISARVRSRSVFPRISATPYSVTTLSTVFFDVVTTDPGVRVGRIFDFEPSRVVACKTMNPWPLSEYIAPREKSYCPPLDEKYCPATVSDAHWP